MCEPVCTPTACTRSELHCRGLYPARTIEHQPGGSSSSSTGSSNSRGHIPAQPSPSPAPSSHYNIMYNKLSQTGLAGCSTRPHQTVISKGAQGSQGSKTEGLSYCCDLMIPKKMIPCNRSG